ncbi:MAG: VWA domain-containing protein [Acidobacteria bacterium]|nr:VWA domain-containing protein [Acidobacteriota bacterium]
MKWMTVFSLTWVAVMSWAAGTLTPVSSTDQLPQITDHVVHVVINNGFAMTTVEQVFVNPNDKPIEALYTVPVPQSAALSEMSILLGDLELQGEVLPRDEAERVYQEEKNQGNEAGLATKEAFDTFAFRVTPVPAQGQSRFRYVYYQPIQIDTSVGRYVYPLQEGGTDKAAVDFWTRNTAVNGRFEFDLTLKSAWPISAIRLPGVSDAVLSQNNGQHQVTIQRTEMDLTNDIVVYYQLAENLPGRVELMAYRPDDQTDGTFMLILTPGLDLKPLNNGANYVFVLDYSGSMDSKIAALQQGVQQALGQMNADDQFRIIHFGSSAVEWAGWTQATLENVQQISNKMAKAGRLGGTNLYNGLQAGLQRLDDDRATSLILITDGVANEGLVNPRDFHDLMRQYDLRVFGFLMGNNTNWPLMRAIANASGGFYAGVSNADDIIGQVLLAKSKITHEALHDAQLSIKGVNTYGVNKDFLGKIYRGQQLVFFGRYTKPGRAKLELHATLSGADKTYQCAFDFPEIDTDHPELERLWALASIEHAADMAHAGLLEATEADDVARSLGLTYQLVTDQTSMVVMRDEQFSAHGIERRNRDRIALERQAQTDRSQQPIITRRVDQDQPMFDRSAPSIGGGALDPWYVLLASLALAAAWFGTRTKS